MTPTIKFPTTTAPARGKVKPNTARLLPVRKLDTKKTGLARWLGTLERKIMLIVWEHATINRPITVKTVASHLLRDYQHDVAYTTTMTTMARLYTNGMLDRKWATGAYTYSPRETKEEFIQRHKEAILAALDNDDEDENEVPH